MSVVPSIAIPIAAKILGKSKGYLKQELGYDFVQLIINIIIYFTVAWFTDNYIKATTGQDNFVKRLLGVLGGIGGIFLSNYILDFFTHPENKKFSFWDAVKIGAVAIVAIEAVRYYNRSQADGIEPSPFTLAIFGFIITALSLIVIPDWLHKMKEIQTMVQP